MRKLLVAVIVAAGLWTGYWWAGAWAIEKVVNQVFAAQTEQGRVATNTGVAVHGIPNRFDLRVDQIELADPMAGWGWKTPFLQVYAMTWKPWHILAALPSDQTVVAAGQSVTVASDPIRASLRARPTFRLPLAEIVLEAHHLALTSDANWALGIDDAYASIRADATPANSYRLGLKVSNITPDAALIAKLADTALPPMVPEVYLDAHATLSAPLDRHAGETKPQLIGLEIVDAHVLWGDLDFYASGSLAAGKDGLAEGEIAMRVKNWRVLPKLLVDLGFVKPEIAPTVERALQVIAAQTPDREVLAMTLRSRDGWVNFGPFPLGPAPRFN